MSYNRENAFCFKKNGEKVVWIEEGQKYYNCPYCDRQMCVLDLYNEEYQYIKEGRKYCINCNKHFIVGLDVLE